MPHRINDAELPETLRKHGKEYAISDVTSEHLNELLSWNCSNIFGAVCTVVVDEECDGKYDFTIYTQGLIGKLHEKLATLGILVEDADADSTDIL